ncbi:hypothetical protein VB711_07205, partial [Cronbergia sp. UHCC 0137]|nr:hypothetical protein [Cronbergia sp. UHCC 0137]
MAKTNDAIKIIDKITSSDPELEALVEEVSPLNIDKKYILNLFANIPEVLKRSDLLSPLMS